MTEVLRWSKSGFAVMFVTGGLLFMAHAGKAYGNAFFRVKLMLLLLSGHQCGGVPNRSSFRRWRNGTPRSTPAGAKLCAGLSLIAWIGVIVCGRTMAYQF